jgi:lipid II:glycine glycyltransferase (peptidoglycan interpeptide bridge formation enzyme)
MVPMTDLREASAAELEDWDRRTVEVPGGHVFQSRTWAAYRSRYGWRSRFLVFDDGFGVVASERPWPIVGGAGAYVPRGPAAAGEPAERTADRLLAVSNWLAAHGVDVVSSDAEIPADSGYPALLRERGFRGVEELQPSRHRVSLPLEPGADADSVFRGFTRSLRQTIRTAEHKGLRIVRYDRAIADSATPGGAPPDGFAVPSVDPTNPTALEPVIERLHDLLAQTAERRHFPPAPRRQLIDAGSHAVAAGLAFQLEARSSEDELVATSLFYRHGRRITYALSADRVDMRQRFPGVVQLVLWRAIQVAIAERRDEFDLAGVDIKGARHKPREGDEMYGLLVMKERFGARWVDLAGNHQRVMRPWRYAAGRIAARVPGAARQRSDAE